MRADTPKHIMIAHNRQLRLRASLSKALALFFMVKAVSLMLLLLSSKSYEEIIETQVILL